MNKPKVGDKLYLVHGGINVRSTPRPPKYVEVTKVGRKYFTVTNDGLDTQFTIDGWRENTEYVSDYTLYKNVDEYIDSIERAKYLRLFEMEFRGYGTKKFTLQQFQEAANALGISLD